MPNGTYGGVRGELIFTYSIFTILFLTGFWILTLHRTLPLTLKFYISGAKAV